MKFDVEKTAAKTREAFSLIAEANRKIEGVDLDFVNAQERGVEMHVAISSFILNEINNGTRGKDIIYTCATTLTQALTLLATEEVFKDFLKDHPESIDMEKYAKYAPDAKHAMIHIFSDLMNSAAHAHLYRTEAEDAGEVDDESVTSVAVTAETVKVN